MAEAGEPVGLRRLGRPGCGKLQPPGKWFTNAALAMRHPSLGLAGEAVWQPQTASFAAPDGPFRGAGRPPSASGWPSGRWQGGAGEAARAKYHYRGPGLGDITNAWLGGGGCGSHVLAGVAMVYCASHRVASLKLSLWLSPLASTYAPTFWRV